MMMKKLIGLALASTATLLLAGCGASDSVTADTTTMTNGTSNKTGLGGYWWTYVDRSGLSSVIPDTGKEEPNNPTSTALKGSIATGNGIDDDGTGNMALHVSGTVAPEPVWSATLGTAAPTGTTDWRDVYWDASYGSLCGIAGDATNPAGMCAEVKYPSAGLGMGFKKNNEPLGADVAGKVGIAFKFRLGAGHLADSPVAVSLPMDLTDVPDPSYGDVFGTNYDATMPHSGVPAVAGVNTPFCTFTGTLMSTGAVAGNVKTCFANLMVEIPAPSANWSSYCVRFSSFTPPAWGKTALQNAGITTLTGLEARILKLQFDAFKPAADAAAADFDFWVDDVMLVDEAQWAESCGSAVAIGPIAAT